MLTDAEGYTLYWFGPDTARWSACQGACARNWPPVTGPAAWQAGVTGTIGAFARPDGSLQATYDGHPLYTTTADTAPGQAKGNGVWSNGGEWHEVTVTGPDRETDQASAGGVEYSSVAASMDELPPEAGRFRRAAAAVTRETRGSHHLVIKCSSRLWCRRAGQGARYA